MRLALVICAILICGLHPESATAQLLYGTTFDSPPFVNGDLPGQDGWISTNAPATPGLATIQSAVSFSPARSIHINAALTSVSNWWWKPLNHVVQIGSAPIVQVDWRMYIDRASGSASALWGVDVYDGTMPLQRRVTAVAVDSTNQILVWNDLNFVSTGVIAAPGTWHHFRATLNYAPGSRNVAVYFNGVRIAYQNAFGPGANDTMADVDLYHVDAGGNDAAFFDNLNILALSDGDGDGAPDIHDICPNTQPGETVDANGCSSADDDGDGVPNDGDLCPNTPLCATVGSNGCPSDGDGDLVFDGCDNCPTTPNGPGQDNQADADGDGTGDACDICPLRRPGDTTGDGLVDGRDAAIFVQIVTGGPGSADERCASDINEDTQADTSDIPGFVEILLKQ